MTIASTEPAGKRLLASIHDVHPGSLAAIDQLAALVERHLGGPRFAMLVVPEHWGGGPIGASAGFSARLRAWADQGVEMFVHGWFHQDRSRHSGVAALKARHMTASEGEFLGLSQTEAARRMADGKALVEDMIGRPAAGFIAPAWLYGPGALAALRESGFVMAEDHLKVWRADTNDILARGPVLTWASRSALRTASSLFAAGIGRLALRPLPVLRVAVHPGDVSKPAILRSIDATLASAMRYRAAGRYADLLAA